MHFEVGERIADYEIVSLVGVGGQGRVYRVRNTISHRIEAMKVLLPDLTAEPEQATRFLSEIRTLAALDHAHIARLHTAMQTRNELIMLMEYVDGSTLHQLATQAPLPPEKIVDYMHQVLAALSFAHSRGVIHRDIKPANIMVTPMGIVKLTDFGIAKSKVGHELTRPGLTVGSLNYMSPEQAMGGCKIDGRADLYSLGITMYEVLAGRRPFEDESTYVLLQRQLNEEPRPPREVNPLLSRPMNDLILKALEKDPSKRFQSAAEFSHALREVAGIAASTPDKSYTALVSQIAATPEIIAPLALQLRAAPHRRVSFTAGASAVLATLLFAVLTGLYFLPQGALAKTTGFSINVLSSFLHGPQGIVVSTKRRQLVSLPSEALTTQGTGKDPAEHASAPPEGAPPTKDEQETGTMPQLANKFREHKNSAGLSARSPAKSSKPRTRSAEPDREGTENGLAQVQMPDVGKAILAPARAEGSTSAELQQLRNETIGLDARAATLRLSVQRLKSQQEAVGDGLSQDVANAYVRMNAYLNAGKTDLQEGDAAAARDHIGKVEAEENILDKLFKQ